MNQNHKLIVTKTGELYLSPVVEVSAIDQQGILCSSKPESNPIENMKYAEEEFSNWL